MKKAAGIAVCAWSCVGTSPAWPRERTPPPAGAAGRRGPNFPQQTRPLASPEILARGKAVYGVNCTACHGADLRDQHGEAIGPIVRGSRQDKGMPPFNLGEPDVLAVAEYIHSVLAKVGSQAHPPGAVDPSSLHVLVGSAPAGETYFKASGTPASAPPATRPRPTCLTGNSTCSPPAAISSSLLF
jgi:hypothetical protein